MTATATGTEASERTLLWRAVAAQTRAELVLTLRRGENILITVIVPAILLIFFAALGVPGIAHEATVPFLMPGILATIWQTEQEFAIVLFSLISMTRDPRC